MKQFSWWIWVRALRCGVEYFSTAPNGTDGGNSGRVNPRLRTVTYSRQTAIMQTFLTHVLSLVKSWWEACSGERQFKKHLLPLTLLNGFKYNTTGEILGASSKNHLPQLLPPNFCWHQLYRLATGQPSSAAFAKIHYTEACLDYVAAGHCAHFCRSGGKSHAPAYASA